jgi:hypothetical protein
MRSLTLWSGDRSRCWRQPVSYILTLVSVIVSVDPILGGDEGPIRQVPLES